MIQSYYFFGFSLELLGIMGLFGLGLLAIVWHAFRRGVPGSSARKKRES